jgi:hypothetical protein
MNAQGELFPSDGKGFKPDLKLKEPLVWIRRLLLLRDYKAGEENVIRDIALRPGLNILWARPRAGTGKPQLGEQGIYGHASGKTTFCRLIRHVLGEKHFGNSDLSARIRAKFPRGWIIGEVRLKGESWLACRPFSVGPHPFAVHNATVEKLFADDLNREQFSIFTDTLSKVVMEQLPVATFATSPEPIEWPHLIEWLTRDQECRFAELTDFRHKSSESESPDMDVEDKHFLFRAVTGLIDTAEQEELENNKGLVAQKQAAEKNAPLLRHQAKVTYDRLRAELPDSESKLAGELFLDAAKNSLEKQERDLTKQFNELKEPEALRLARQHATDLQARKQRADERAAELREAIERLEKQLEVLKGNISQKEFDDFWRNKNKGQKLCLEPLTPAVAVRCPFAAGKIIPEEPGKVAVKIETKIENVEKIFAAQKKQLAEIEKETGTLTAQANRAQTAFSEQQIKFNRTRDKIIERRYEVRGLIQRTKEAREDEKKAERLENSIGLLEKEIRKSLEKQTQIRKKQRKALTEFSESFENVTKAVLGLQVSGSIGFNGRQIEIKMSERGDLTSAAIETIKILTFDLAALIRSVEGRGFHPRFLVHDGPREADMAADLYQKLFLLTREVELSFGANGMPTFQYIVTTTEPPPDELQNPPWRTDPILDASTKDGRLFREDL